jgi:hypothetical protein
MTGTQLHVHIDLADMLKDAPPSEATVTVPPGYRCQNCWRNDGAHDVECEFYGVKANEREREPNSAS